MKQPFAVHDEFAYEISLKGVGRCKVGYLFWPCFHIKLLVMWDADADTLNKVACDVLPNSVALEEGGAYAWIWDLEDDDNVKAEDYTSPHDQMFTHVMCLTKRPRSDADGMRACVAHEALHITKAALDKRGLKFTPDAEEAYTYQMESIVFRVNELMKQPITKRIRR